MTRVVVVLMVALLLLVVVMMTLSSLWFIRHKILRWFLWWFLQKREKQEISIKNCKKIFVERWMKISHKFNVKCHLQGIILFFSFSFIIIYIKIKKSCWWKFKTERKCLKEKFSSSFPSFIIIIIMSNMKNGKICIKHETKLEKVKCNHLIIKRKKNG